VAILTAVLIVAVVTALNDYEKERQFESLSEENDNVDAVVVRDGVASPISVRDIVVGDVVSVEAGDQIPCDGVLLSCDGLELDESALTGEPIDVDKDLTGDPFVLSGCTASAGAGTFVATAVGRESQWGVIKSHLEKEQDQTPLQEKLDDMAALIGYVGMAAALATFVAMMIIKLVVRPAYLDDVSVFHYALDAFIIGVTIVVVAVPEGLPLAVTISLAYSTKKMLSDQNLIRHLAACETMGNATNICSDKTGTLTENRMTVVRGVFANVHRDDTADAAATPPGVSAQALEVILQGIATCSTARIVPPEVAHRDDDPDGLIHDHRPVLIGNKTEAALLALATSPFGNGDDYAARRSEAQFGKAGGSRLFPFSSARKRMSVIVRQDPAGRGSSDGGDSEGAAATPSRRRLRSIGKGDNGKVQWTLYHKGAAESVLAACTTYLDADGSAKPLTAAKRSELEATIKDYTTSALRCVALCHRYGVDSVVDVAKCTVGECAEKLETDMCLDALVGIADPLRPDVVDAVAICQRAGIFVRMVTGDNLDTAMAIAKEAGILHDGEFCGILL
jgi:Ca2+-transporting ATPase